MSRRVDAMIAAGDAEGLRAEAARCARIARRLAVVALVVSAAAIVLAVWPL